MRRNVNRNQIFGSQKPKSKKWNKWFRACTVDQQLWFWMCTWVQGLLCSNHPRVHLLNSFFLKGEVFEHPQSSNAVQTETKLKQTSIIKKQWVWKENTQWRNYWTQKCTLYYLQLVHQRSDDQRIASHSFLLQPKASQFLQQWQKKKKTLLYTNQNSKSKRMLLAVSPSIPRIASTTLFPLPTARIPACKRIDAHEFTHDKRHKQAKTYSSICF